MDTSSPREDEVRRPHPLAQALIERLRYVPDARVLELGAGRGRNTSALTAAGFEVCAIADDRAHDFTCEGQFDAAISTHALLHGTPALIAQTVNAIAQALKPHAPLHATFGSKADARYGQGTRIDDDTYAPESGDEQGVAHAYFDESTLREMLERRFIVESIEERAVDDVVGRWAHAQRPLGSVHWFVRARRL